MSFENQIVQQAVWDAMTALLSSGLKPLDAANVITAEVAGFYKRVEVARKFSVGFNPTEKDMEVINLCKEITDCFIAAGLLLTITEKLTRLSFSEAHIPESLMAKARQLCEFADGETGIWNSLMIKLGRGYSWTRKLNAILETPVVGEGGVE